MSGHMLRRNDYDGVYCIKRSYLSCVHTKFVDLPL